MYMTGAIGGYSFTLFLPVILQNSLGYSQELSFILSTPPVVFAVLVGGVVAWLADKIQLRGPFVAVLGTAAVVGFCMMGFLESATARLIGEFSCSFNRWPLMISRRLHWTSWCPGICSYLAGLASK